MTERTQQPAGERSRVTIAIDGVSLDGTLTMPPEPLGGVIFAHGSGSSRLSPRNRAVAHFLNEAGFATLLFDLLTVQEDTDDLVTHRLRFDIPLLARRLVAATDQMCAWPETAGLSLGYFGASTGAAAALIAAAERPSYIDAVVSRGGRPDLAGPRLAAVHVPTLLIVGGRDREVIALNELALAQLGGAELAVVPGAGHLFEEPGALEQVAQLAASWFTRHLG